jgi:transcriptional regulator GlxA family with amidase domain
MMPYTSSVWIRSTSTMTIIIGMPVYQGVDLLDVTGPFEILNWMNQAGRPAEIHLIAERAGDITTRDGFTFKAPMGFGAAPRLDVLWVPGGAPAALKQLMRGKDRHYLEFLVAQAKTARFICSVCEGALLLAAAGLLDGFQATTHWAFTSCLQAFPGVTVVEGHPRFVVDGNRLTGGGISSGLDEALKLIELLTDAGVAQSVQQNTQYYPCPPVASRIPAAGKCPLDD